MENNCKADVRRSDHCQQMLIYFANSTVRNSVLKTPKRFLRKCRHCSFKKRTCVVDPFSCNARHKNCSVCFKVGHYPQSMNCKAKSKRRFKDNQYRFSGPLDETNSISPNDESVVWEEHISINHKNEDLLTETMKDEKVIVISQLDGNDDPSLSEDEEPCKEIYAVNCSDKK